MKKIKFTRLFTVVSAFMLILGTNSINNGFKTFEDEGDPTEPINPYEEPPEGYTRYEAEDSVIEGCVKKGVGRDDLTREDHDDWEQGDEYGVYSGVGFVGRIDNAWSALTFTVNVSENGAYPIYVGYAIGKETGNAQLEVFVNGNSFATWTFKQKNGWGSFDKTMPYFTTINLSQGLNTIRFLHKNQYVEIDYIDIGPCQGGEIDPGDNDSEIAKVPEGFTRYEAENGDVVEGNIYRVVSSNSGTGFVGELDISGRSQISWNVTVPTTGEYTIRVAYAIGAYDFGDASFKLLRNDDLYSILSFTVKNGWGVFDVDAIEESTISLYEGTNKVTLAKAGNYAQLDFIDISNEPVGEFKEIGYTLEYPNQKEGYTRYEAEEQRVVLAESKGIGYFVNMGSYSGRGFVGSLDNDYQYVEFPMNVEKDGEYSIRVAYACAEVGASLRLFNGQYGRGGKCYFDKEIFATVATDWGTFTSETIIETTINIKAGKSYILVRGGNIKAEIDYIDLGSRVGDYNQGEVDELLDRHN